MPRKGKGGARTSPPGTVHPNRTDMVQPARAKTGQTYGVAGAQIAAQQAMPLPAAPPTPTPGGPPSAAGGGANPLAVLAGLPGLTDPTQRPNEPLTSGLPIGAGPNGPGAPASPGTSLIRKMIAAGNGDPVLFQLLAEAERAEPPNSYAMIPPPPPVTGTGTTSGFVAGQQGMPMGGRPGRAAGLMGGGPGGLDHTGAV